ncbi:MAG: hypothetical protein HC927_12685, partial [Deltaproteobacteria bacterium]|nr:hypothetical protein [Deltaproteobacteria bacterium]
MFVRRVDGDQGFTSRELPAERFDFRAWDRGSGQRGYEGAENPGGERCDRAG